MRVLVACEFSGIVRDAFTSKGHDAISCDLLPSDRPGNHFQGNVFDIINDGFDLMIAHPPCTYLCLASNTIPSSNPSLPFRSLRLNAFNFFFDLYNCSIPKIAIENPIGFLNSHFRPPDQILHAYDFGHPFKKDICLWLKNLPPLFCSATAKPPYRTFDFSSKYHIINGRNRKSITFQGFADAMASQWD